MSERESRRHFTELVAQDADADLAEAALLIACEEYPTLDVASYIHRLEELAGELRRRLDGYGSPEAAVAALNKLLFAEGGFRGNLEDYYDPRNSFLNEVLDRRTGIPITLSAVYLEVGRRAGLDLHGVGLPGHFVVKLEAPGRELIIDPFHAGALVSAADCQRRLDRIYAGRVKLERSMLAPWSSRQILGRLLRNLKLIYVKHHDWQRALAVVELLLCCEPDSTDELRDRGLLYAALDCFDLAARDLEEYVARAPHAPEAMRIRDKAAEMRRRAARLN